MPLHLHKAERLHKKSEIDLLFDQGKRIHDQYFTLIHAPLPKGSDQNDNLKFMIGVPKKKVKKAVDRNLIRRRIREAYRLHRGALKSVLNENEQTLGIGIIYNKSGEVNYKEIEVKIILLLRRLEDIYAKNRH